MGQLTGCNCAQVGFLFAFLIKTIIQVMTLLVYLCRSHTVIFFFYIILARSCSLFRHLITKKRNIAKLFVFESDVLPQRFEDRLVRSGSGVLQYVKLPIFPPPISVVTFRPKDSCQVHIASICQIRVAGSLMCIFSAICMVNLEKKKQKKKGRKSWEEMGRIALLLSFQARTCN